MAMTNLKLNFNIVIDCKGTTKKWNLQIFFTIFLLKQPIGRKLINVNAKVFAENLQISKKKCNFAPQLVNFNQS